MASNNHLPPLTIFIGTKAQFIKMAPLAMEFQRRGWRHQIIDTGQHAALVKHIIDQFHIQSPIRELAPGETGVATVSAGLRWMSRLMWMLTKRTSVLKQDWFCGEEGWCFVHGDTASTLLSALLAKRANQHVAHVEAGLRSHQLFHPFPEELIRIQVMRMADLLFAPSLKAHQNLQNMGLTNRSHLLPGNTSLDTLHDTLAQDPPNLPDLPQRFSLTIIHRLETLYSPSRLKQVMQFALQAHACAPLVFVLHPPTERRLQAKGLDQQLKNAGVLFLPLLDHPSFIHVLKQAQFVMTDGGSVQEEASYLGVPCLLLRKATERDDGLGENVVLSQLKAEVIQDFLDHFTNYQRPERSSQFESPSAAIADKIMTLCR
jgi:UDP-N-acetylglucosamine 2-epimerase (non-hydrolysing)